MEVSSRYSFGMAQPGRSYVGSTGYNYSYNGKEKVDEWNGVTGGHYDYGFRVYDPRSAKFLSVDPLTASYPWYTPYQFAGNKPIIAVDLDGLEEYVVIRWYDQEGRWVGSTVFRIDNAADRTFGQTGILYLQLTGSPQTKGQLELFINLNKEGSFTNTVRNPANGIVNSNNTLVQGVAFLRTFPSVNATEQNHMNNLLIPKTPTTPDGNFGGFGDIIRPPDVVSFSYNAPNSDNPNIEPDLDDDENGITNKQALKFTINALNANPEYQVTLYGSTSTEGDPDYNLSLSQKRVELVRQSLINAGVNPNRIVLQPEGESNPTSVNPAQNDPNNKSVNRKVIVKFNVPKKTQ